MPAATDRFHSHSNGYSHDPYSGPSLEADHAERALCACLLLDSTLVPDIGKLVSRDDFRGIHPAAVFGAITRIAEAGDVPDVAIVVEELSTEATPGDGGWVGYLLELMEIVPTASNAARFARSVREAAIRRRIRSQLLQGLSAIESGEGDVGEIIAEVAGELDVIGSETKSESRFKLLTAAELDATDHSISYLVEGILVEGQPCMIGGVQKTLKTSLALALFLALSTGGTFLGRFPVSRRCRTLLLSGESGLGTITETLRRIADAEGYTLAAIEGLHVCSTIPRLDRDEDLAELRGIIRRQEIEVVGIDPAYLCMPSTDTANLFAQGELLRRVGELCEKEGATLILLHHAKKSAGITFDPIELADLSYSGFAEWARQWLLIGRREKYLPGTGDHRLWLTVGGSAGHNSLWAVDVAEGAYTPGSTRIWDVSVRPPDEVRKDDHEQQAAAKAERKKEKAVAELEQSRKEVVRFLVKRKEADTFRAIRIGTGLSDAPLKRAIASLLDDDTIVEAEVIKNKRPESGFAIKSGGQSDA